MLTRPIRTALVASCAVLALSACREDEGAAQAAVGYGVAPSALAYDLALAPDADALPATRPAAVGRLISNDDGYAWAERAYAMDRAFHDAPPDYGFYYDDVQPWVWQSQDEWALYAEPISDGYRYYYYEPGADYPYLVRDDEYGYGYDDAGRLVTLYTVSGVLLPATYLDDRAERAGRYWSRAHDLRRAATHERRARIDRDLWLARQPVFTRSREPWMEAAVRRDDWRTYRARHEQRDVRRFEPERLRREASVKRLNREELRRAEGGWWRGRDEERRQVAVVAPREDRRWEWGGRRDVGRRDEPDHAERDGRRQLAQVETERRGQQQARAEGERRGREGAQARQEQRRQQLAQADGERRGREMRERQVRSETERRGRGETQQAQRRAQMEQARNVERGRQEAQMKEARQQQARAEGERRGRQEMQARQEQRRVQMEQVRHEQRGRQEAQMRERQGREQQAGAEGERRGREQAQQRQQAENERRGRDQQAQAQRQQAQQGREQAQAQQQARQEARNAGQAARDAGGRERGERGHGRERN